MSQVVPVFNCPSRRTGANQPARSPSGAYCDGGSDANLKNANVPETLAKTDYVINGGWDGYDNGAGGTGGAPQAVCLQGTALSPKGQYPNCTWHMDSAGARDYWAAFDGVSGWRVGARSAQIIDGASQTVLVGEKWVAPRYYGGDCAATDNGGDNSSMFQGYDPDSARKGGPLQDTDGENNDSNNWTNFGSPHPGGANISFCDGSVRTISYDSEDQEIPWSQLMKRNNRDYL
jgi:prepilin-type processing-associated H-X9-DG protein